LFGPSILGCASIVSDNTYAVAFSSSPQGAQVTIADETEVELHREKTPFTVTLGASAGYFDPMKYSVRFELQCYEPAEVTVGANLDEWYFGNLLFGGLIGMLIVDPLTGSMWELEDRVSVVLRPGIEAECTPAPP
jgi:hypothetical protein